MKLKGRLLFFSPLVLVLRALAWPYERLHKAQLEFIASGGGCSANQRQRRRELYAHDDDWPKLQELAAKLQRKRERDAKRAKG